MRKLLKKFPYSNSSSFKKFQLKREKLFQDEMHEYPYRHCCLALAATSFVIFSEQVGGIFSIPATGEPIYCKANPYLSANVNQLINGWGEAETSKHVYTAFNYKIQKQRKPFLLFLKKIEPGEKSRLREFRIRFDLLRKPFEALGRLISFHLRVIKELFGGSIWKDNILKWR